MPDLSKFNLDGTPRDLKDAKAFRTDDSAETNIADGDYFPFYDVSASTKKKSLWSNIIEVLKNTFSIKSHASTTTTYGVGTDTQYGHVKAIDNLNKTSNADGEALSAHMGYCLGTMFAPVEPGPDFSQVFIKDYQFVYNGVLYKLTANRVGAGDPITVGGNCEPEHYIGHKFVDMYNWMYKKYRYYSSAATAQQLQVRNPDGMYTLIIGNDKSLIIATVTKANVSTSSLSTAGYSSVYLIGSSVSGRLVLDGMVNESGYIRAKVRISTNASFTCYGYLLGGDVVFNN